MGKHITFQVKGHISFDDWILANPDIRDAEEPCKKCNGTGYIDCPHCGQDMDCDECDGHGKVHCATEAYREQCFRDKTKWQKYVGGKLVVPIQLHGKRVNAGEHPNQLLLWGTK